MSETTTKTPAEELAQAEQEVEAILESIKAGDLKFGPADLEKAEARARFCRARVEGEERRRVEEEEQARLQRVEELRGRAVKELDPEPVRKAKEKAEKALSAYVKASVDYNVRLEEIAGELDTLGPLPENFVVDRTSSGHLHVTIAGGEGRASQLRPMVEVSNMARESLREHIPRGYIDLENPY